MEKSLAAEDFIEFVDDFWRIKQNVSSPPGAREKLEEDLIFDEIKKMERFEKLTQKEFEKNWEEGWLKDEQRE